MKLDDVKSIGVLGAGVMGGGIAQSAIVAGFNVIVRDLTDEICEKAKDTIINGRFGLKGGVERGKQTQEEMDQALARLSFTTKVEDLKDCDLIIEAIGGGPDGALENKPLKLEVFTELDKLVKKEAVFASNTSFFTIADLAAVTERKDLFVGMHLFSPANIMKLVEVTYTEDTSEETIKLIEDLSVAVGKTPVRVKDVPGDTGFIANRIFAAASREAMKIVEEGIATAEDVNTAMTLGFRWPIGPLAMAVGARSGWK
ncbi:MAG: 3-hydroxyacyl-CoA dehydrogenase family protein [Deltaproteobacteria bacterium]|nr:3-hydroxyacyl-CoA dehydrogenase family protein [Deltaproteobacteria bacterium]MBW2053839.1 3-hydroxyacyl-CoA dehydrogenase family protein [Deltaproteobacteria bacterium]MBW2142188.1 3-hydroxyacyl-CoA dehydrogenase family protein [Deltaproteobacteria bacterium]MBW2324803.1 3-hydroxyacyl-CoA dehydrogenase family protein [Deltaproteobacteria bacterium]